MLRESNWIAGWDSQTATEIQDPLSISRQGRSLSSGSENPSKVLKGLEASQRAQNPICATEQMGKLSPREQEAFEVLQ